MLVRKIIHPWRNPSVATRKIEKNAPSDSLHYSCYTSSPLQAPSRHQTILKQVISSGRWVPPALDSSLTPCDKLGDSRFGPPHTHSSKCLGTLTGFLEENVPVYFSKNRRKLEDCIPGPWGGLRLQLKLWSRTLIFWSFLLNPELLRGRLCLIFPTAWCRIWHGVVANPPPPWTTPLQNLLWGSWLQLGRTTRPQGEANRIFTQYLAPFSKWVTRKHSSISVIKFSPFGYCLWKVYRSQSDWQNYKLEHYYYYWACFTH